MRNCGLSLAIVLTGLFLAGCDLNHYFDDPAIRACRNDTMNQMVDATSYGDVRVNVELKDGATGISIDHDFLTADGVHKNANARCEFTYFNGFFHFHLPASDDDGIEKVNLARWNYLMDSGLAIIADSRTLLAPSRRDFAIEACIRNLGGGGQFPLPPPPDFNVEYQSDKDDEHTIRFASRKDSAISLLPKSGRCEVTQLADGNLQVTSHDVVR